MNLSQRFHLWWLILATILVITFVGEKVLAWQREQPRFVSNQLGHGL